MKRSLIALVAILILTNSPCFADIDEDGRKLFYDKSGPWYQCKEDADCAAITIACHVWTAVNVNHKFELAEWAAQQVWSPCLRDDRPSVGVECRQSVCVTKKATVDDEINLQRREQRSMFSSDSPVNNERTEDRNARY